MPFLSIADLWVFSSRPKGAFIDISLPEIVTFKQRGSHRNAWSDHYGALYVAAEYCDAELPDMDFPHIWQHGSIGPWTTDPTYLFFNSPDAHAKNIFVAREDEAILLRSAGYLKSQAIGLPILYTQNLGLERIPNSLLIMPQHSLVGIDIGTEDIRANYVHSLEPYLTKFDGALACVSASCLANGYYKKDFEDIGVDVISGAATSDVNAYLRMRALMEQFEIMTTNCWGSHVVYALYFGMKVAICGEYFQTDTSKLIGDWTWRSLSTQQRERGFSDEYKGWSQHFKAFFQEPTSAIPDRDLGAWYVGEPNKKEPDALRELFGWRKLE